MATAMTAAVAMFRLVMVMIFLLAVRSIIAT